MERKTTILWQTAKITDNTCITEVRSLSEQHEFRDQSMEKGRKD